MRLLEKIGLQLYTVRDEAEKDFLGTLKKVSEIGYSGVEFAGFFNIPAHTVKETLDQYSLVPIASHTPVELLKEDLDQVIAYNKVIGTKYIVCPWAKIETMEDIKEVAELMNAVTPKIREAGMGVGYHNHDHELKKFNGEYGLDILMKLTEKTGVFPQIDVFWVEFAGLNPIEYISKYANRSEVIHLKDMKEKGKREFTEVGNGIIDMRGVIQKGLDIGAKYFTVEQDQTDIPSLESVDISFRNLKAIAGQMGI